MPIIDFVFDKFTHLWKDNIFRDHFVVASKLIANSPITDKGIEVCYTQDSFYGLLIVGLNPSGTDKRFYLSKSLPNVIKYTNNSNSYINACDKFATACGYWNNYSMLDVFGVIQARQSVIVDDLTNYPEFYERFFCVFAATVQKLLPEVIVFANAFLAQLIAGKMLGYSINNKNLKSFKKVIGSSITYVGVNPLSGGFILEFKNGFRTNAFFSSMLSGQRALDLGSKNSLIWMVRNLKRFRTNSIPCCPLL